MDLLRQAADLGEPAAMFNLAERYSTGSDFVAKNPEKTAEYFSKALTGYRASADAGERRAYFQLGIIYMEGKGVASDDRAAVAYFQEAAALNDTRAMLFLAYLERDPKTDFEWCRRAAELGDPLGMVALAAALDAGEGVARDPIKAHEWRLKAADAGLPVAMFLVGRDYEFGNGVKKDGNESWRWFRKASQHGTTPAFTELGIDALHAQDFDEARKNFEAAAEIGNARALYYLGTMYAHGRGTKKDEARAVEFYRRAAKAGNPSAMNNLGLMQMNGTGTPRNEAEAVRWFTSAAEQGNPDAMHNLALAYRAGRGITADSQHAQEWEQRAAAAAARTPH
jgi:TPR repeat protein